MAWAIPTILRDTSSGFGPLPGSSDSRFPIPYSRFPTYGTTFLGSIRTTHSPVTMSFT